LAGNSCGILHMRNKVISLYFEYVIGCSWNIDWLN
jgi:hypothetical protein